MIDPASLGSCCEHQGSCPSLIWKAQKWLPLKKIILSFSMTICRTFVPAENVVTILLDQSALPFPASSARRVLFDLASKGVPPWGMLQTMETTYTLLPSCPINEIF